MGAAAGAVSVVGSLLGLGASLLMNKKPKDSGMGNYQAMMGNTMNAMPAAPAAPQALPTEPGKTNNAEMEAAREKEKQAALLRQQQNASNPNGGLGLTGQAYTQKKTLLGG